MNDEYLKAAIIEKVNECYNIANKNHNRQFANSEVQFFENRAAAGLANAKTNTLHFNLNYARQNINFILNEVVPHEVAHLVQFQLVGYGSHDRHWKHLCLSLGGNGQTKFDNNIIGLTITKKRKTKYYQYNNGKEAIISSLDHKKIQSGYVFNTKKGIYLAEHFTGNVLTNV